MLSMQAAYSRHESVSLLYTNTPKCTEALNFDGLEFCRANFFSDVDL